VNAEQIVVSPCSNPDMGLDEVLSAYSSAGYSNFEVFTGGFANAFDYHGAPEVYLAKARQYNMAFTSLHLPAVSADALDETLRDAVTAARFASELGADVVLYKAKDRPTYIKAAPAFLDAVQDLPVTPVVQNHCGSALTTLDDVKEVLEGISDTRMRALLEVGHFHAAGVPWRDAAEFLGDSIALVHIKDQVGPQSVPFGMGEIDLPALFAYMNNRSYSGRYVIEMEVQDRENTLRYLADARQFVLEYCEEDR